MNQKQAQNWIVDGEKYALLGLSVKVTAEGNYNGSELDVTKLTEVMVKGD